MYDTQLTSQQLTNILRQFVEGDTVLKRLELLSNSMEMDGVDGVLKRQAREKLGGGLNIGRGR